MRTFFIERGLGSELKASMYEKLEKLGFFWIGADVVAAETLILAPRKTAFFKVILKREEGLPPIDFNLNNLGMLLPLLNMSTRSRLALLGAVTKGTAPDPELSQTYNQVDEVLAGLTIAALGGRPIIIKEGEGVACLYANYGADLLRGESLIRAIGSGIKIGGDYGKDWSLVGSDYQLLDKDFSNQAVGIGFRLERTRYWIPPSQEPIDIFPPEDYRSFLDQEVFEVVPAGEHKDFWVVKTTSPLTIEKGYNGVLNLAVKGGAYLPQTPSTLIKGGQTDWQVMAELFLPPKTLLNKGGVLDEIDYNNMWILIHFYEDRLGDHL